MGCFVRSKMIRVSVIAVAMLTMSSDIASAFAPSAHLTAFNPAFSLRPSAVKPRSSMFSSSKKGVALKMSGGEDPAQVEDPAAVPPPTAVGQYSEEDEKRYIQQSSGTGYRKNNQDSLLFAMGASILLIPFIAVAIAIGTGYIPLDYV